MSELAPLRILGIPGILGDPDAAACVDGVCAIPGTPADEPGMSDPAESR